MRYETYLRLKLWSARHFFLVLKRTRACVDMRSRMSLTSALPDSAASARSKAIECLDLLPPLSPVVGRLLSQLASGNLTYKMLSDFVEKDVLLCAHILRTVNSAAFARPRTINSVAQAISLLGVNKLRRIVVGFGVTNLFAKTKTAPSWSRIRFNFHSGATGILTEAMVDALPVVDKDGAFVAGLMHDLGRLMLAVALPEEYETITAMVAISGGDYVECEREALGFDHAELSGLALTKWKLPELICRAATYHHSPQHPNAPWLSTVVHRADRFVDYLGICINQPSSTAQVEPPSLDVPGFEFDQAAVLERFEKEWKELSEFFRQTLLVTKSVRDG
jgi:HD-like signal output (HDOD) protein